MDARFVHALHTVDLLCSLTVTALWIRKSYVHRIEPTVQKVELAMFAFFIVNYALRLLRAGLAPSAAMSVQVRAHAAVSSRVSHSCLTLAHPARAAGLC